MKLQEQQAKETEKFSMNRNSLPFLLLKKMQAQEMPVETAETKRSALKLVIFAPLFGLDSVKQTFASSIAPNNITANDFKSN